MWKVAPGLQRTSFSTGPYLEEWKKLTNVVATDVMYGIALERSICASYILTKFNIFFQDSVLCVQYAKEGHILGSGSRDKNVRIWIPSV